jgi:hypothetical protein
MCGFAAIFSLLRVILERLPAGSRPNSASGAWTRVHAPDALVKHAG